MTPDKPRAQATRQRRSPSSPPRSPTLRERGAGLQSKPRGYKRAPPRSIFPGRHAQSAHTTPHKERQRRALMRLGGDGVLPTGSSALFAAGSVPTGNHIPQQMREFQKMEASGLLDQSSIERMINGESAQAKDGGYSRARHSAVLRSPPTQSRGRKAGATTDRKGAHRRRRSKSVDPLWFKKRSQYENWLSSAWWKLEQKELDAFRQKTRRRAISRRSSETHDAGSDSGASSLASPDAAGGSRDSGESPPSPRRRKRAIKSPPLVSKSRPYARVPLTPAAESPTSSSDIAPRAREQSKDAAVQRPARHSTLSAREAARWQNLRQVDKLYNKKLTYRPRSARGRVSSGAWANGPTRAAPAVPGAKTDPAGAAGATRSHERLLGFWKHTVIPGWRKVAHTNIVRRTWDRYGVPGSLRRYVWPLALGCERRAARRELFEESLRREEAMMMSSDDSSAGGNGKERGELGSHAFGPARLQSIMQDLNRMPELDVKAEHAAGGKASLDARRRRRSSSSSLRARVRAVVVAFLGARPGVSYVQGMSYLALMLVTHMDPADAFACLCNLLDCDYFHAYLDMNAERIRAVFRIFDMILEANLPRLHARLASMGILPDLYLVEWCLTLFSKNLSMSTASRVWDGYLIHGELFVFRTAVAILALLKKRLEARDTNACVKLLMSRLEIDAEALANATRVVRTPPTVLALFARIDSVSKGNGARDRAMSNASRASARTRA